MPKPVRFLLFLIIILVLLPVMSLGLTAFSVVFLAAYWGKKASPTAFDPLFARYYMHHMGTRPDPRSAELMFALPGMPRPIVLAALGPFIWAAKVTGFPIAFYDYPNPEPAGVITGILAGRTTFFDNAITEYRDKVAQIVFLGAGWDTRPYYMAQAKGVAVYEVDKATNQAIKRGALDKAGIDTSDVRFTPADFNRESWLDALKRTDFDPARPTFVLLEAVSYYLEPEGMVNTLRLFADELAPGSVIAFDYVSKDIIDGKAGLIWRFLLLELKAFGEPWQFGISLGEPAEDSLSVFAAQFGLEIDRFLPAGEPGHRKYALAILTKR